MDVRFAETAVVEEVVGVEIFFDGIGDFCILQAPLVELTPYICGTMFRAGTIGLGFSEPFELR